MPVLFVLGWREVSDLRMEVSVVVPVDPFDDRDLELSAGSAWVVKFDQFGLKGAVDGFCHRVVVAVSNVADRSC